MTEWTFALVDLAGYTALTETHGDEHAAELATTFAALATECLASGDRLVKPIGDAVLPASTNPSAGISLVDRLLPPRLDYELVELRSDADGVVAEGFVRALFLRRSSPRSDRL